MVLELTPPCPDYASSNPNPMGELGDKGGREFTKIPSAVRMAGPKVVFIVLAAERPAAGSAARNCTWPDAMLEPATHPAR